MYGRRVETLAENQILVNNIAMKAYITKHISGILSRGEMKY